MVIFPVIATCASTLFAFLLFRQYASRRRIAQLAWGIALAQFAVASLAVSLANLNDWDPTLYRIFWLFGALLNVPWLATGSIALVGRRVIGVVALALVIIGSAYAVVSVFQADLSEAALRTDSIPVGKDVWGEGASQTGLLLYYSIIPYLIVVGIAIWSSIPRKGLRPPPDRKRGNVLIAVGVTIVAVGGTALRRIGRGAPFSITLAVGVIVMFAGFILASRAPRYSVESPGDSPT